MQMSCGPRSPEDCDVLNMVWTRDGVGGPHRGCPQCSTCWDKEFCICWFPLPGSCLPWFPPHMHHCQQMLVMAAAWGAQGPRL